MKKLIFTSFICLIAAIGAAAQSVSMHTTHTAGDTIRLIVQAEQRPIFDGAEQIFDKGSEFILKLKEQTVTIKGNIHLFDCSGCGLDSLITKNAPELRTLRANGNRLKSIDLSDNRMLEIVNLNYNKLEELDLGSLTSLRDLDCCGNKLKTIDLSDNRLLKSANLSSNELFTLDLRHNTRLEMLLADHNQLSSLETRALKKLRNLRCGSNHIKTLILTANKKLRVLDCDNSPILMLNLSRNRHLRELHLENCPLKEINLKHNRQLRYIYSSGCEIHLQLLTEALPHKKWRKGTLYVTPDFNVLGPRRKQAFRDIAFRKGWDLKRGSAGELL